MNSVCITGRLTATPEHRPSNGEDGSQSIAEFRLAINEPGAHSNGDGCSFINVVCYGPMADSVATRVSRGSMVGVQGRIQQREWTNADEQRRSMHRIVAHRVEFLERRVESTSESTESGSRSNPVVTRSDVSRGPSTA